jgi:glycosyltransferase EpsD
MDESMKILYVATVSNTINAFMIPHIKMLINQGHSVDIACNIKNEIDEELFKRGCRVFDLKFQRSPFKRSNFKAYKELKKIIVNEGYDLIHTHTPVASACSRFACRKIKDVKVIYTAHGFHFFKGASLKNWMIYYFLERILARWTDAVFTMNSEDFNNAKKFKMRSPNSVFNTNGVGVDLNKFMPQTKESKAELRKQYGYSDKDFIMIYVGELSKRKNQKQVIESMGLLKDKFSNLKLLLVGRGSLENSYRDLVKQLGLEEIVLFLGYRKDVPQLMGLADIAVSSSKQEGLPVNVMEAMATGLPLVVTNSRGNRDLVLNNCNGYVVKLGSKEEFASAVEKLYMSPEKRNEFGKKSLELVKKYSLENVLEELKNLYSKYLD